MYQKQVTETNIQPPISVTCWDTVSYMNSHGNQDQLIFISNSQITAYTSTSTEDALID